MYYRDAQSRILPTVHTGFSALDQNLLPTMCDIPSNSSFHLVSIHIT